MKRVVVIDDGLAHVALEGKDVHMLVEARIMHISGKNDARVRVEVTGHAHARRNGAVQTQVATILVAPKLDGDVVVTRASHERGARDAHAIARSVSGRLEGQSVEGVVETHRRGAVNHHVRVDRLDDCAARFPRSTDAVRCHLDGAMESLAAHLEGYVLAVTHVKVDHFHGQVSEGCEYRLEARVAAED